MTANGILFVDKAEGWTSHDVVAKARRSLGTRKVGHAGTLDPMATGLLTLGAGPSTRLLTHMVGLDKTYVAVIRLGQSTITDDREGELLTRALPTVVDAISDNQIISESAELTGNIEQRPSAVSAIKVDGRRAYDLVRAGEEVTLKSRPVTIHKFELGTPRRHTLDSGDAVIDIEATVLCSSGTYIRALARDLGAALGIGGHLVSLRRTAVGPFVLQPVLGNSREWLVTAITTEQLVAGSGRDAISTPAHIASKLFPVLTLTDDQAVDLGHGKTVKVTMPDTPVVAARAPDGRLVGLVSVLNGATRVVTNFPTPISNEKAM